MKPEDARKIAAMMQHPDFVKENPSFNGVEIDIDTQDPRSHKIAVKYNNGDPDFFLAAEVAVKDVLIALDLEDAVDTRDFRFSAKDSQRSK